MTPRHDRTLIPGWQTGAGAGLIGALALALLVWAVADFVFAGTDVVVRWVDAPPAAEVVAHSPTGEAIELHRLMPDATNDLGRLVRLNGTVLAVKPGAGFWVRDLRDHVVYVASGAEDDAPLPAPGSAVSVRGVVSLFSPEGRSERRGEVEAMMPENALVVWGVKLVPLHDGIERVGR